MHFSGVSKSASIFVSCRKSLGHPEDINKKKECKWFGYSSNLFGSKAIRDLKHVMFEETILLDTSCTMNKGLFPDEPWGTTATTFKHSEGLCCFKFFFYIFPLIFWPLDVVCQDYKSLFQICEATYVGLHWSRFYISMLAWEVILKKVASLVRPQLVWILKQILQNF